jgi:hypothetical protein
VECNWRLTLTKRSDHQFELFNEEKLPDGPRGYIDEWKFQRVHD